MVSGTLSERTAVRHKHRNRGVLNMDYVFGTGLVVVIVAALVLTVYFGFIKPPGAHSNQAQFVCFKCGDRFEIPLEERPPDRVDCPSCGEKRGASRMMLCPACKKYTPMFDENWKSTVICKECGADRNKIYRNMD